MSLKQREGVLIKPKNRLSAGQVRLIDESPRQGAHGRVAFVHPKSAHGVLIELIEYESQ